jgi:hypothetical protein
METYDTLPPSPPSEPPAPVELPVAAAPKKKPEGTTRKGKVARLPKAVRDRINEMIQDGFTYLKIIEALGPDGETLNEDCLSTWKAGGYQDWLRDGRVLELLQSRHEFASELVKKAGEGNNAPQAILQIIATNLCEFLGGANPASIEDSLLSDSDKFTRFVNSMVRLAEGSIKCETHNFRQQDRVAEAAKNHAGSQPGGIRETTLQTAEEKLNLL